jgi:uncharacterized protein YkwD
MVARRRADTRPVARLRLILLAALMALCLGAALGAAQGLANFRTHKQRSHLAHCPRKVRLHHGHYYRLRHGHLVRVRCSRHSGASKRSRLHRRLRAHRHGTGRRSAAQLRLRRRTSAADANQCADANLMPSDADLERIRAAVLCLVNRERAAHGESALQRNARLELAAQSHTESMAGGNYFEHVGPGGDSPVQRMRTAGYLYSPRLGYEVAENLAWGTLWLGSPRAIVAAWMASPPHRANILDPHLRDSGVGVSPHVPASLARGQAGGIYTQDFGVIVTR